MASQSGQSYLIAYKPQTVIGTPVTGAGATVLRTLASTGFSLNRARIQSEEIRADGMRGAPRKGVKSGPGSYACELSFGTFDPLFECFMRSTFAAGVLVPGTTKSFLTFEQYHRDVDLSLQVETVRPISMAVTVPAEAMCRIDWGFMGRNIVGLATGTSPNFTSPTLSSTEPMAGIDATITGPGAALFTSASFSLNRGGGVQAVIGDVLSPDVYDGSAAGEGTLSSTLETMAYLSEVSGDTPTTLSIAVPDGIGNIITFDLANVMLENFQAPVGQAAAMIVTSAFSFGGTNALTITNT